jgi:hypothetical protein
MKDDELIRRNPALLADSAAVKAAASPFGWKSRLPSSCHMLMDRIRHHSEFISTAASIWIALARLRWNNGREPASRSQTDREMLRRQTKQVDGVEHPLRR